MPKLKNYLRSVIDAVVWMVGGLLGLRTLPTFFNGRWIWMESSAWSSIYRVYEPRVASHLQKVLKKGDCFFDVGAHHGVWSLYAETFVGKQGKVYAFEPSPAYDVLARSVGRKNRPILPLRVGIGRSDGRATFFDQGNATSGSFVKSVTEINAPYSPTVPIGAEECSIRSLDSMVEQLGRVPEVVKIDIEGFEVEALKGASNLLERGNSTWIVEVHPLQLERSGSSPQEVFRIFEERGYRVEKLDSPANQPETIVAYRA